MLNFSERLNDLITESGKTLMAISHELGCGEGTLSRYCSGNYTPSVDMLINLADYFKCSADFLLGLTEQYEAIEYKPCPPFSERLIFLCDHFHISRYRLQKLTDIPESVMRYWVRGKTKPSVANVLKIAVQLDCSVDFVLGREV